MFEHVPTWKKVAFSVIQFVALTCMAIFGAVLFALAMHVSKDGLWPNIEMVSAFAGPLFVMSITLIARGF